MRSRIGIGFDAHAFTEGRPLVLGGVTIEHPLGLAGHSDADVLSHAVADSLLGAAGLEDIGHYFPDTDPAYRDISSLRILERVRELITAAGCRIGNVDAVLVLEAPRIAPHRHRMRAAVAAALAMPEADVSLRATTTEMMGFAGRGEGIAAMAVSLLESDS
ncbi:MAG: 2-C-methyl-D-erythritol 2,4-cyclodiphosphate synthase [Thermoleophilia bacterium]|jgi:2-C-methyl-D-erythritol 2,4-cyclodiphosphate synthase|nr:2-C-methyl-D-erythritol 2,4-cyclodiphosphate synthase [Actinomycetota bacterium]MCL6093560.1 2-C-methyl-D-erythritol 2,4-cyclodiphosphate synthase [Actinomycetota bacterium]MDA8166172.1 2-C-methyl-D-erythritol 2,4-cyclodiphosphate synthase [Actinomycetota bacterium]